LTVYYSDVRKKCPYCENTMSIVLEMCPVCERRLAAAVRSEDAKIGVWAAGGIRRLEAYLASWAAFEAEYPDPD
jgi:hypothetical protein